MTDPTRRIVGFNVKGAILLLHLDETQPGVDPDMDIIQRWVIDSSKHDHDILRIDTDNQLSIHTGTYKFPVDPVAPGRPFGSAYFNPAGLNKTGRSTIQWFHHNGLNLEGDFTFDFWFRVAWLRNGSPGTLSGITVKLYDQAFGPFPVPPFDCDRINFEIIDYNDGGSAKIRFAIIGKDGIAKTIGDKIGLNSDVWNHVALARQGTLHTAYYNGTAFHTYNGVTEFVLPPSVDPLETRNIIQFDGNDDTLASSSSPEWVDEVRLIKKVLWTANFTPPEAPGT